MLALLPIPGVGDCRRRPQLDSDPNFPSSLEDSDTSSAALCTLAWGFGVHGSHYTAPVQTPCLEASVQGLEPGIHTCEELVLVTLKYLTGHPSDMPDLNPSWIPSALQANLLQLLYQDFGLPFFRGHGHNRPQGNLSAHTGLTFLLLPASLAA